MPEKLGYSAENKDNRRVPWKARAFAATGLALAGVGVVNCGGGEDEKSAVLGAELTTEPSLTATIEIAATASPTIKATETPVPTAEIIQPVSDVIAIKAGLSEVYKGQSIPQGSCSAEAIQAYAGQLFDIYQRNPNKFSLVGGIASIYAELSVIAKSQGNVSAGELAKSIRAGVEILIVEHLQEKGLPASNKAELVTAWEQNVARKIEAINDGSGCDIVLEKGK